MSDIEKQIAIVAESFGEVSFKQEFYDTFYEIFINCSPAIKPMFASTDMEKQKKMLKKGISYMILYAKETLSGQQALKSIAEIHDRNHKNIKPHLYPLWVESLCSALKKHNTEFTKETENAWREVMEPGIKYFTSLY